MTDSQLNSLARFRKRSPRLVLEEHGCEVPAGCAGVVLRWRDPLTAVPFVLRVECPVPVSGWVDGVRLEVGRFDLAPGPHVLGLALEECDLDGGLLLATLIEVGDDRGRRSKAKPFRVHTGQEGWVFRLDPPAEGWTLPNPPEEGWQTLALAGGPKERWRVGGWWNDEYHAPQGAKFLGPPASALVPGRTRSEVWVRRAFEVPQPQLPEG